MLGFATYHIGTKTFLRFNGSIIDVDDVQAISAGDTEDTKYMALVWLHGNTGGLHADDTQDYAFFMLDERDAGPGFFGLVDSEPTEPETDEPPAQNPPVNQRFATSSDFSDLLASVKGGPAWLFKGLPAGTMVTAGDPCGLVISIPGIPAFRIELAKESA